MFHSFVRYIATFSDILGSRITNLRIYKEKMLEFLEKRNLLLVKISGCHHKTAFFFRNITFVFLT